MPDTAPLENYDAMKEQLNIPKPAEDAIGGYEVPGYRPPPQVPEHEIPGPGVMPVPQPLPNKTRGRRAMYPHLQLMTNSMLKYDTVKNGVWHGFMMIVTSDEGSSYDPIAPSALLEWDATEHGQGFQHSQPEEESDASVHRRQATGIRIFTYHSVAGPQSFWRFKFEVPLVHREQEIFYSVNVSVG